MMKKMLLAVTALTMPIAAAGAVGVAGSGVAGAAPVVAPTTTNCAQTGTVTFPAPGLSLNGAITNKTVESSGSTITPSGTGCSGSALAIKIASATTACPTVGNVPANAGGVPLSSDAPPCKVSTTNAKTGVVTYAIAKDPYQYDSLTAFGGAPANIAAALDAKPLKTTVGAIKVVLNYGTAGTATIEQGTGSLCGSNVDGFYITGTVAVGANPASGTWTDLICLTGDTGPGTTGNFNTDTLLATAIQTATIGGPSALKITLPNGSCDQTGTVTFPAPGLSLNGAITNKTVESIPASITPTGAGCSGSALAIKIASATTACPTVGNVPANAGGVPLSSDAPPCKVSTTNAKTGVVTYAIAKDPYQYDSLTSFANAPADIAAALNAKPLKTTVGAVKVVLNYGTAGTATIEQGTGSLCGSNVDGFYITGTVTVGANPASGTWTDLLCLTGDSGPGTTGNFNNDTLLATAITGGTVGGPSALTITLAP